MPDLGDLTYMGAPTSGTGSAVVPMKKHGQQGIHTGISKQPSQNTVAKVPTGGGSAPVQPKAYSNVTINKGK